MKTFNSFFKSANAMTTLAIAAIALTSVFGFTSCDKDNEAFDNGPKPQRIEMHRETFGSSTQYITNTTYITNTDTIKTTTTNVSANDTEKEAKVSATTNEVRARIRATR